MQRNDIEDPPAIENPCLNDKNLSEGEKKEPNIIDGETIQSNIYCNIAWDKET